MASYEKIAILAMFLMILGTGMGQTICNVPISGLMACKPADTPPKPPQPSAMCCSALARANIPCLCSYRQMLPSLGIDPGLAMKLPQKCKLPRSARCPKA